MPRIITTENAALRKAVRKDGSVVKLINAQPPAKVSAPEPAQTIDTTPIANEIAMLTKVVGAALSAQSKTLSDMAGKKVEVSSNFEFTVTQRDEEGRIKKITAKRL